MFVIGDGNKPARLFAPGTNPASPTFADLLFDADHAPLRVHMVSGAFVAALPLGEGYGVRYSGAISLGKTFTSAPLALSLSVFNSNDTGYAYGASSYAGPTINGFTSQSGHGVATMPTAAWVFSWGRSPTGGSGTQINFIVFDRPVGG